jgi:hypothetical protein
MDNISEIKDEHELDLLLQRIKDQKKLIRTEARKKKVDVVAIAQSLATATQSIFDAQKAYEEKGFFADIETDQNTGLIIKWKLKNRRPKKQGSGGVSSGTPSIKQLKPDEFKQILSRLPDTFGSTDIRNALIGSGIGDRKLQPAFGNILKGMYGVFGIEKVAGTDKGPGVRYRKVN